jgi:hypothetical protein
MASQPKEPAMPPLTLIALATVAAIAALATRKARIETEIQIDAPPAAVWAVLTDGAAYPDWNPFIRSMKGTAAKGQRLENTMQPMGRKPMTFRPRVLVADPHRELRWLGRLPLPRLFDGEHYFLLEPQDTGTRLIHGESFRGLLLWVMNPEQFRPSFRAMNQALKARVETLPKAT